MQLSKKVIKYIASGFLTVLFLLFVFIAIPYVIAPVYEFSKNGTFSGEDYYNPYQQKDSSWQVCNFHAHSRSWGGITDGKNTNIDTIFTVYQNMGYTHVGISNYQKISYAEKENLTSIPAYEHGFNIKKRHHLCLGAERVSWLDFFFFQTLSHKQYVLNQLRSTTDFLTINHPKFSNGFEESDFSYLCNYDAVEVLNHYRTSIPHWDSALSSGYYAVLLANDDMHKLDRMDEVGVNFTVVNTHSIARHDIIRALKAGRHYGVKVHIQPNENYRTKQERIANLVHPQAITMLQDTLSVVLSDTVSAIRLIGQGGVVKNEVASTDSSRYVFSDKDTYIRIEIEDRDSNLYLFNPIVRTDDPFVVNTSRAEICWWKTCLKRTAILSVLVLLVLGIYWKKKTIYNVKIKSHFQKPYRIPLWILIGIYTAIRIFVASAWELGNDEVYYRLYALFPDFSHFDHPPMVGLLIQLTTWGGLLDTELFIRLGSVVLGAVNIVLAFKIGSKMHSEQTGFVAAFLFCISPYVFLIAGVFILPDTPLLFFWMLALWLAVSIFTRDNTSVKANKLLYLGIVIGLAGLAKYTAVFLWIGIALYILLYDRKWLKRWQLYLAVILSAACLLPVLYWNIQNDFISFTFHGDRVSLFTGLCFSCLGKELVGEFFYNNPFLFVMIYFVLFRSFVKKDKEFRSSNRLFYCIALPMILVFMGFSLFRDLLPHWNAPAYTTLIFSVALFITQRLEKGNRRLWLHAKIWAVVLILILIVFQWQVKRDIFKLKGSGVQDFTIELSSWKKTGIAFDSLACDAEKKALIQPNAPIIATRWFPAANLDMYVAKPSNRKVLAIGSMERIHKYAWINEYRGGFHTGMDAWFITDDYDFIDPDDIASHFKEISAPDTLRLYRNGEVFKSVYVYRLKAD